MKSLHITMAAYVVAVIGIVLYTNKTQREIDRLIAEGEEKIRTSTAESDRLMKDVLRQARNTHL